MIIVNEGCSIDRYWDLEDRTEYRNEYIEGQVISQIGMGLRHGKIVQNLLIGLMNRQADQNWQVLFAFRTKVERTGAYVWPDIVVFEDSSRFEPRRPGDESLLDPVVLVEVVIPLTAALDRGTKWAHYQSIPSLREYVFVAEDKTRVERFVKRDDVWLYQSITDPNAVLTFTSLGCAIPLHEIYRRVKWPTQRESMLIPPVDLMR